MTRVVTDSDELTALLSPIADELPQAGTYHATVQFNTAGEVIAYQLVQIAVFAEGLRSLDSNANLRILGRMTIEHAKSLGATQLFTLTAQNTTGERVARFAKRMGFSLMPFNILRRNL